MGPQCWWATWGMCGTPLGMVISVAFWLVFIHGLIALISIVPKGDAASEGKGRSLAESRGCGISGVSSMRTNSDPGNSEGI